MMMYLFTLLSVLVLEAQSVLPPNGIRFSPVPGAVILSTSDDFGFSRVIAVGDGVTTVSPGEAVFATCDLRFVILGTTFCTTTVDRLLLTPSSLEIASFATTNQECDWEVVPTSSNPPNLWTKIGCNAELVCLATCPYDPVPTAEQILTSQGQMLKASCAVWQNCTVENLFSGLPSNSQFRLYCAFRSGTIVSTVQPEGGLFFRTGEHSGPYRFILSDTYPLASLTGNLSSLVTSGIAGTSPSGLKGVYVYFNQVLTPQQEAAINKYIASTEGLEWACNSCTPSPCKGSDGCSSTGQDTYICITVGTKTPSPTITPSRTRTTTATATILPSKSISRTITSTRSSSLTSTYSSTPTSTRTPTTTSTATPAPTKTSSSTTSPTPTVSPTPSPTFTPTDTITDTSSQTITPSSTPTSTRTFKKAST